MASDLFVGQGRPRPRLFLVLLLLFLILGTVLVSAVTGADYVRGNGDATAPDDRPGSASTAFSAQDDRCVLVVFADDDAPQAFLLWRLRPAAGAMAVTAYDADKRLPGGVSLAAHFGDGGRGGCERVADALARARIGTPAHYVVLNDDALRALMERLGDTLTLTLPEAREPIAAGRQAVTAERLLALLSEPLSDDPDDRAAHVRFCGDVWAALCERFFTAARADELAGDFATLVNHAQTDLGVSHFVTYRDALTALAAQHAGRRCPVTAPT